MPILILILLGVIFFFILKNIVVIATITAIITSGVAVIALVSTWLGTSYGLKKAGYHPHAANHAYSQVDSDLKQIVADLQETRSLLEDAEPHLRNLEFLKYARQNRETEN